MPLEQFSNLAKTTLSGNISAGATSLAVASAAGFPSTGQFRIIIDSEIFLVTGVSGTTFTVTPGYEGTTQANHSSGALLANILTAGIISSVYSNSVSFRNILNAMTTDTASISDGTINWLSSAATKTQNIPAASAANNGKSYTIKDGNYTASLSNPINITPASGTIEQASSLAISVAGGWAVIQSDGTSNWIQIG